MQRFLQWLRAEDSGQDLVEYALLAALISTVSVALLTTLGQTISALFAMINAQF
jgi:Flp pilus assembly pilin Flp